MAQDMSVTGKSTWILRTICSPLGGLPSGLSLVSASYSVLSTPGWLFLTFISSLWFSVLFVRFSEQLGGQGFLFRQGSLIVLRSVEFLGLCFQGSLSRFGEGGSELFHSELSSSTLASLSFFLSEWQKDLGVLQMTHSHQEMPSEGSPFQGTELKLLCSSKTASSPQISLFSSRARVIFRSSSCIFFTVEILLSKWRQRAFSVSVSAKAFDSAEVTSTSSRRCWLFVRQSSSSCTFFLASSFTCWTLTFPL